MEAVGRRSSDPDGWIQNAGCNSCKINDSANAVILQCWMPGKSILHVNGEHLTNSLKMLSQAPGSTK